MCGMGLDQISLAQVSCLKSRLTQIDHLSPAGRGVFTGSPLFDAGVEAEHILY